MADVYLAKVSKGSRIGLIPTDEASEAALGKLGDGEIAQYKLVKVRSLKWHKMYFGICTEIGKNQDPQRDKDSVDAELRVLAGHYDVLMARKGNSLYEVRVPKRIAFDKMTGEEWEGLFPSLDLAIRERFGAEYLDGGAW